LRASSRVLTPRSPMKCNHEGSFNSCSMNSASPVDIQRIANRAVSRTLNTNTPAETIFVKSSPYQPRQYRKKPRRHKGTRKHKVQVRTLCGLVSSCLRGKNCFSRLAVIESSRTLTAVRELRIPLRIHPGSPGRSHTECP